MDRTKLSEILAVLMDRLGGLYLFEHGSNLIRGSLTVTALTVGYYERPGRQLVIMLGRGLAHEKSIAVWRPRSSEKRPEQPPSTKKAGNGRPSATGPQLPLCSGSTST